MSKMADNIFVHISLIQRGISKSTRLNLQEFKNLLKWNNEVNTGHQSFKIKMENYKMRVLLANNLIAWMLNDEKQTENITLSVIHKDKKCTFKAIQKTLTTFWNQLGILLRD